jgi:hypothetical protein
MKCISRTGSSLGEGKEEPLGQRGSRFLRDGSLTSVIFCYTIYSVKEATISWKQINNFRVYCAGLEYLCPDIVLCLQRDAGAQSAVRRKAGHTRATFSDALRSAVKQEDWFGRSSPARERLRAGVRMAPAVCCRVHSNERDHMLLGTEHAWSHSALRAASTSVALLVRVVLPAWFNS